MAIERTLSVLKPDAIERGLVDEICNRFERNDLRVVVAREIRMTRAQAEGLYEMHRGKDFYPKLIDFMCSGPSMVQVLEGEDVVTRHRALIGDTISTNAKPGTIRGDLADPRGGNHRNLVHGSDARDSAEKEIALFFSSDEYSSDR